MANASERPADDMETIIYRYGDMLYRLCVFLLKNESDAEDAVQETMIKYYRKAPTFQNEEHTKAWLIRVATNQCRDMLRFRARHPQLDDGCLEHIPGVLADGGVIEALVSLPKPYRLVLTLHYIEGYRVEEIAKIIRRTPSAVKMRLQKGRKLLETIYREENG